MRERLIAFEDQVIIAILLLVITLGVGLAWVGRRKGHKKWSTPWAREIAESHDYKRWLRTIRGSRHHTMRPLAVSVIANTDTKFMWVALCLAHCDTRPDGTLYVTQQGRSFLSTYSIDEPLAPPP